MTPDAAPRPQPTDPVAARRFAVEAARLAAATRSHDVAVLDVTGISPITDFFVIATGTSPRQMRTVCDQVEELGEKEGFKSFSRGGYEGDTWIVVDFIDVLVHIFSQDARLYYDLDNLWGDARIVAWQEGQPAPVIPKFSRGGGSPADARHSTDSEEASDVEGASDVERASDVEGSSNVEVLPGSRNSSADAESAGLGGAVG